MAVAEQLLIEQEYVQSHPQSQRLFAMQKLVIPGGITHTSRFFEPFPLFIKAVSGSHKWDVDGHEYIDYWMGHGANLLGHRHPQVIDAISQQLSRGLHAGGENELALEWAQLICQLVPSAERVRFCASGGEATQMAIRVARAFTGKDTVVKFEYHYHGWHDAVAYGIQPPFEVEWSAGLPRSVAQNTVVLPFNDIGAVRSLLDRNQSIACIILEPAGGFNDTVPVDPSFLSALRDVTRERKVVLIFDEVVTGFRYAPGGAQQYFGVTPDITALGKVVGGGLPTGAVVGRADIMEVLAPHPAGNSSRGYIPHHGTWNGVPITAAAGLATLRLVADGKLGKVAQRQADKLRAGLNSLFASHGVSGVAYGRSSILKTYLGEPPRLLSGDYSGQQEESRLLRGAWGPLARTLRQSMILRGVDLMHTGGFVSAIHTDDDIEKTVQAFDGALDRLKSLELV